MCSAFRCILSSRGRFRCSDTGRAGRSAPSTPCPGTAGRSSRPCRRTRCSGTDRSVHSQASTSESNSPNRSSRFRRRTVLAGSVGHATSSWSERTDRSLSRYSRPAGSRHGKGRLHSRRFHDQNRSDQDSRSFHSDHLSGRRNED